MSASQLVEAASGRFNPHVHVEYDWNLRLDELDESDDEPEEKVSGVSSPHTTSFLLLLLLLLQQPSPVKKERSVRPQSFCPSSGASSQDKPSLPVAFIPPHRDKQRLSYGAFVKPVYSASCDGPDTSGPAAAARHLGRGEEVHGWGGRLSLSLTADKTSVKGPIFCQIPPTGVSSQ